MKEGTLYASRLKKAYQKWKQLVPEVSLPEGEDDPIRRLAVSILGVGCSEADAQAAVDRLLESAVDWNEIRVSLPVELLRILDGRVPDARSGAERLIQALQSIFEKEHKISLDRLKTLGRREARQYLEGLRGVDDYAAASVMFWSLGGHAVPVSDAEWQVLKEAELVHPQATRGEVQAFLERHIPATEAKKFCSVLRTVASKKSLLGALRGRKKSPAKT